MSPLSPETSFDPNVPVTSPGTISEGQPGRVLEPMDRIIEVLCGLIMVLTFTLVTPVSDRSSVRSMLIAALGCNLAWGIVDAAAYLMLQLSQRRRGVRALRALRKATDATAAHWITSELMPPVVAAVLRPAEIEVIRLRLSQLPEPGGPHLSSRSWRGALGVFLLVFLSTLPVVIPFAVVGETRHAKWISNLIALTMLFFTGYAFGRVAAYHPVLVGLAMVVLGGALVAVTVALGG